MGYDRSRHRRLLAKWIASRFADSIHSEFSLMEAAIVQLSIMKMEAVYACLRGSVRRTSGFVQVGKPDK